MLGIVWKRNSCLITRNMIVLSEYTSNEKQPGAIRAAECCTLLKSFRRSTKHINLQITKTLVKKIILIALYFEYAKKKKKKYML